MRYRVIFSANRYRLKRLPSYCRKTTVWPWINSLSFKYLKPSRAYQLFDALYHSVWGSIVRMATKDCGCTIKFLHFLNLLQDHGILPGIDGMPGKQQVMRINPPHLDSVINPPDTAAGVSGLTRPHFCCMNMRGRVRARERRLRNAAGEIFNI